MELFDHVLLGFQVCLQPSNLLWAFIGCLIGTLVGVLPGLGPTATISLLLPMSYQISPVGAIIMLSGVYYGAMYGGSTTSILVNIPGEAASVVTCLDGYQMAKQGRAGPALGMSAFGSFIAGTFATFMMVLIAPPLAQLALKFGPVEYTALMVLGMYVVTFLVKQSMLKSFIVAVFGIFLSCIGIDSISGTSRLTFGKLDLLDGIGLAPIAMGLFGISEVLINLEEKAKAEILNVKIKSYFPTKDDWKRSAGPISRGSVLGFFLGIIPGGGGVLASFMSYAIEKRIHQNPELFGTGMIEGLAGPESANNSGVQASFIPLLTLGIPTNVVIAVLMGAMLIHGIQPGPQIISEHPDLFWGVMTSMYLGNAMLVILNLPLIPLWVQLLKVRYGLLFPMILLFCVIGCYSINNSTFDILVMLISGIAGYFLRKTDYDSTPLILAYVLGNMFETSLRQSLIMSGGSFLIFIQKPIAAAFLAVVLVLVLFSIIRRSISKRPTVRA